MCFGAVEPRPIANHKGLKGAFNNHQDVLAAGLSSHLPPQRMLKASVSCPRPGGDGGARHVEGSDGHVT